ncbi:MAG TPA: hydrogenase maturation protease [Ktedonobacterales bacterium]|nr:hydrogenase maturation protease [Ktedonobacterales bacterium]
MSVDALPQPTPARVLVACVGNVFLGDDGFGVEVARHLAGRPYPAGVVVADFGIRGVELAYTLLDGCETLVLVDAVARGGAPGTLYLIEPESPEGGPLDEPAAGGVVADAHSMDPARVLAFARRLGARPGRVLVVGCEPAWLAGDGDGDDVELRMGLSEPVRAALDGAVEMIDSLIEDLLAEAGSGKTRDKETRR